MFPREIIHAEILSDVPPGIEEIPLKVLSATLFEIFSRNFVQIHPEAISKTTLHNSAGNVSQKFWLLKIFYREFWNFSKQFL